MKQTVAFGIVDLLGYKAPADAHPVQRHVRIRFNVVVPSWSSVFTEVRGDEDMRPRSVKNTSALVRVLPDLAPTCVITTAGNGQTEETRPRVSRSRVGSMRAPKSPTNRRPGGETATRLTIRWAIERPGS